MRSLKITNTITRRDEKSLEKYLAEISKKDILSPELEVELFQRIKKGDETALREIIVHNLRFVVSVAKQYEHLGLNLADLINEGNIGLIKAAHRFDETKGFKFISYAVWWIRQSILQAVNKKGRKIRLPLNQQANVIKVIDKRTHLLQLKEREPSVSELAEATGLSDKEVKKSLESYRKCSSLDQPIDEEGDASILQFMEDKKIPRPDYNLRVRQSQKEEVRQLLNALPKREASILTLYFGIDREYPMTLSDISGYIGVSKERARQIRDKGLRKLRRKIYSSQFQPTL